MNLFHLINDELTGSKVDILPVSDSLVIERLPRAIWPIFSSFPIFCCYFTNIKDCEITWQNMRNSENVGCIILGTVG